jgi:hypothetical protein
VQRDLHLAASGALTGTAFRHDGVTTVPNATVIAGVLSTTTDAQGRYRFTALAHVFDVHLQSLFHQTHRFLLGVRRRDAAGKIRGISAEVFWTSLNNDRVAHSHFSPACFRILFIVFGCKSCPGWPATVTVPGFVA